MNPVNNGRLCYGYQGRPNNQMFAQPNKPPQSPIPYCRSKNAIQVPSDEKRQELDHYKTKYAQLERQHQNILKQHQEITRLLTMEQQNTQNAMLQLIEEQSKLQLQIQRLKNQNKQAEKKAQKARQKATELQTKLQQLSIQKNKDKIRFELEIKEWQTRSMTKDAQIIRLKQTISKLEDDLIRIQKASKNKASVGKGQGETPNQKNDSQEIISQLCQKLCIAVQEKENLWAQKGRIKNENRLLIDGKNQLLKEKQRSKERINQLQLQIAKFSKKAAQLQLKLAHQKQKERDPQLQLQNNKQNEQNLNKIIKNLEQKVTRLEISSKILKSENQMVKNQNRLLKYQLKQVLSSESLIKKPTKNQSIFLVGTQDIGETLL